LNRFAFVTGAVLAFAGMAVAVGAIVVARGWPDEQQGIGVGLVLLLGASVFAMLARARTGSGSRTQP
jgi:drug/metabolite transporter (DMT)-like permease